MLRRVFSSAWFWGGIVLNPFVLILILFFAYNFVLPGAYVALVGLFSLTSPLPSQFRTDPPATEEIIAGKDEPRHCSDSKARSCFTGALFLGPEIQKHPDAVPKRTVLRPFGFVDRTGKQWHVEAGYLTDGATIPPSLRKFVGSNWTEEYLRAAVIHDRYLEPGPECGGGDEPKRDLVHDVFRQALLASGVPAARVEALSSAVSAFAPDPTRWNRKLRPGDRWAPPGYTDLDAVLNSPCDRERLMHRLRLDPHRLGR